MRKAAFGVAIGLGVLASSFAVLGLVLNNQANFSKSYVHEQLAEKQITFTPVENLLPNQKTVPCLVENAGKQLVSGKQAECYARYQIGLDLALIDNGKTYFKDHYAAYLLRVKAQQALAAAPNDPATQELVQQSAQLSQKAGTSSTARRCGACSSPPTASACWVTRVRPQRWRASSSPS
jgi:hypothetical protein